MSETTHSREERLFAQVVTSYATGAWIALGKIKNPLTDKMERNLSQVSFSIEMLDMLRKYTRGNLSDREEELLTASISALKMNYVQEVSSPEDDQPGTPDGQAAPETPSSED